MAASPPVNFERRYSQRGRKQGRGAGARSTAVERGEEAAGEAIEMSSNGVSSGKGPDRVKEADNFSTWDREGAVKIRFLDDKKSGEVDGQHYGAGGGGLAASRKPVSVPTWIKKCCGDYGNLPAYGVKGGDGKWTLTNYKEYYKQMKTVSSGFYCPKTMICTSCSHAACCSAILRR